MNHRSEFKLLMKKMDDADLQENERQKVKSQNGAWWILSDNKRIFYAGIKNMLIIT